MLLAKVQGFLCNKHQWRLVRKTFGGAAFEKLGGGFGEAPRKIVSTTPFKRSENIGDALFHLIFETFCETFLNMAFVLLVFTYGGMPQKILSCLEFKLCFQIFVKTCLFVAEACNEHLKNTTK